MTDKSLRDWHLLRLIPRHPRQKTPSELQVGLREAGYDLTLRSVQRDLNTLSALWGITCNQVGTANYWYWPSDARLFDIPNIGSAEALVFLLAKEYLKDLLPHSQLAILKPYFERSEELISKGNIPTFRWHQRVRVIQQGPLLKVPNVRVDVIKAVHEALLHEQRVALRYKKRGDPVPREYLLSPHALVLRGGIIYLVATARDYDDLLHFALHRATSASLVDQPAIKLKSFDLDRYIAAEKAFEYPQAKGATVTLMAMITDQLAEHLSERPLSADQTLTPIKGKASELRATVADTESLRWWLMGLGAAICISKPASLRHEMKLRLESALKAYGEQRLS